MNPLVSQELQELSIKLTLSSKISDLIIDQYQRKLTIIYLLVAGTAVNTLQILYLLSLVRPRLVYSIKTFTKFLASLPSKTLAPLLLVGDRKPLGVRRLGFHAYSLTNKNKYYNFFVYPTITL